MSFGIRGLRNRVHCVADEVGFTKLLARSPAALKKSLFMAYFSLSEADADARDKIRRHTQDFGRILIAMHHRADGVYGGRMD